jgi:hypothetical protein
MRARSGGVQAPHGLPAARFRLSRAACSSVGAPKRPLELAHARIASYDRWHCDVHARAVHTARLGLVGPAIEDQPPAARSDGRRRAQRAGQRMHNATNARANRHPRRHGQSQLQRASHARGRGRSGADAARRLGVVRVDRRACLGADVAGAKPSPDADVAAVSPVPMQMWQRRPMYPITPAGPVQSATVCSRDDECRSARVLTYPPTDGTCLSLMWSEGTHWPS